MKAIEMRHERLILNHRDQSNGKMASFRPRIRPVFLSNGVCYHGGVGCGGMKMKPRRMRFPGVLGTGLFAMLPMDALWAKPIFEEQGEYIVFGKLLCENRDQIILVAAGTRSETPVKIKRLELACPVFHKKILKCKMAVDRKGAFYSGVIDESSIQFVPGSEIVTPPVRLKEKRPK